MKMFTIGVLGLLVACYFTVPVYAQRIVARRGATVQINNGVPAGSAVAWPTFAAEVHSHRGASAAFAFGGGFAPTHFNSAVHYNSSRNYRGNDVFFDPGFGYNFRQSAFRGYGYNAGASFLPSYGIGAAFGLSCSYGGQAASAYALGASYAAPQCPSTGGGTTPTFAPPAPMERVMDESTTITIPYRRTTTTITTVEEGGQSTATKTFSPR